MSLHLPQQMLSTIDPDWAWSKYVPGPQQPWDERAAAHLLRRAGFGATLAEIRAAAADSPDAVVEQLLDAEEPPQFLQQMQALANAAVATGNVRQLSAWWAYRMLSTPTQLLEKTTLFWHGHFATSAAKVLDAELMLDQNHLLRNRAYSDFAELLLEISRNPAMLVFLDSATNRKAHPNENFAREIMELFCLGEGHYSEGDIRELARCFTGWEVRRGKFRLNSYQHDGGEKTVLGRTGNFDGEQGVQVVVAQDAAPEFLVRKLIACFVFDEPAASKSLVAPLASLMRESGMQIRPVLQKILSSQLFYSDVARAKKIRSPVELAIGFLRSLEGTANTFELADAMDQLGQGLFFPPSVKGWDGGRTWINSSTLLGRSNLIRHLLQDDKTRFGRAPIDEYLRSVGTRSASQIIDHLELLLFAVRVPQAARQRIEQLIDAPGDSRRNLIEGIHALCTLPEFQLC